MIRLQDLLKEITTTTFLEDKILLQFPSVTAKDPVWEGITKSDIVVLKKVKE
jgi:hypothetical protein